MNTTEYFRYTKTRPDRACIKDEWIEQVMNFPLCSEKQPDGRIRFWGLIQEENKYLRVIVLEDRKTVHNAFFDRGFKEKNHEG